MNGERAEKAKIAARLREQGYLIQEIADRMGVSRSYTSALINDPAGEQDRARKKSYQGVCERCGGPTSGSDGAAAARMTCGTCSRRLQTEERYWLPERIVDAIHRYAAIHGRPPTATNWKKGDVENDYPTTSTVQKAFGSWSAAIMAAGFPKPRRGGTRKNGRTGHWTRELLIEEIRRGSSDGVPVYDKAIVASVYRYFGSWKDAVYAAGLTPQSDLRRRT